MRIITDKDLSPNLQRILSVMDHTVLFHSEYGLKHPSALYNSSLGKIENSLREFLEIYKKYKVKDFENLERESTPILMKNYRDLLYCFREHLDDCFHVIKSFIPKPLNEKQDRNQYSWLNKNVKNLVKNLFENISEYKKYLDDIVNELKHNNASLCCVAFYDSNDGSQNCLGYFVANVINDAFEPITKIHAKVGNTYTAFSFRRDLIYNIVNIYNLSEQIINFIENEIGINLNKLNPVTQMAPDIKKQLFRDVMSMPRIHFPDEYSKDVPSLSITEDEKLKLEYPSMLSIKPNRLNRVVVNHSGDGHTREFKIPYM